MADRPALHAMTIEEVKRTGTSPMLVLEARIVDAAVATVSLTRKARHHEAAVAMEKATAYRFALDLIALGATASEAANR